MIFSYGLAFCVLTVRYSPVAARPEPLRPRAFLNTTLSSTSTTSLLAPESIPSLTSRVRETEVTSTASISQVISSSSTTTQSSTVDLRIADVPSTTVSTSTLVVSSTATSSSLNQSKTSSTSILLPSLPSTTSRSSSGVDEASSSSTIPTVGSSLSTITPSKVSTSSNSFSTTSTFSSSITLTSSISSSSSNTSSIISSTTTSSNSTSSNPCVSTSSQGLVQCINYVCGPKTYYSWDPSTVSTETATITVYGNSTSSISSFTNDTLSPPPCASTVLLTFTSTIEPTTIYSISKTTATVTKSLPPPKFGTLPPIAKSTTAPQPPETQPNPIPASSGNPILPIDIASKGPPDVPPLQSQPPVVINPPPGVEPPPPAITGAPIILGPTQIEIGGNTIGIGVGFTVITVDGQTITANPSQVIGPQTTLERPAPIGSVPVGPAPTAAGGALPSNGPTTIFVNGIPIALSSSLAVVDGTTFTIGPGASERTVTVQGQVISMGPKGVGPAGTKALGGNPTLSPEFGTARVSNIGSNTQEAVIDGITFTFGPDSIPRTTVINGQTFSVGPGGIGIGHTTIGGPAAVPTADPGSTPKIVPTSVITIGHATVTQVGSIVAIGGHTFTIGPNAVPSTVTIDGETISIGPGGVGIGTTTLTAPAPPPTKIITTGGVTITEIGSSLAVLNGKTFTIGVGGLNLASLTASAPTTLQTSALLPGDISFPEGASTIVVIGGTTFTIGPGATPTTDIYKGKTISIGPGGVGILGSSTVIPLTASPSLSSSQVITSQGITYTVLGSTMVIIGDNTFRIGPGATPVTELIDGRIISIGPSGVALGATGTSTELSTSTSKDAATAAIIVPSASKTSDSRSNYIFSRHLLAFCIPLGVWIMFN